MKILFINRWVGYNEGGNETHIKDLITQFNMHGDGVSVITTLGHKLDGFDPSVKKLFVNSPQRYFSYGFDGIWYALLFVIKSIWLFWNLYRRGERYDLISVHFSLESITARIIKIFFGIPYVMVLAGDTPLELIEARRADGKVQISKFMNAQGESYGYSAGIIPKGMDLTKYNPNIETSTLINALKLNNKKIILSVCRMDPRKNLETLVEAAKILKLSSKLENLIFVLVGDGVERPLLEAKIREYGLEEYFLLVGSVPSTSVEHAQYYAMSTIFVLPTLYEGFGWVFLEAMACGVPIITTKAGSNPEVVGNIGELIEPKRADLLAETIIWVLNNHARYNQMRQLGLEKAKKYSWDIIFKLYNTYYTKVAQSRISLKDRLVCVWYLFYDQFVIISSLIRDRVIFNNTIQMYSEKGQAGGKNGVL